MGIFQIIILLCVVGLLWWLITSVIPLPPPVRTVVRIDDPALRVASAVGRPRLRPRATVALALAMAACHSREHGLGALGRVEQVRSALARDAHERLCWRIHRTTEVRRSTLAGIT
jgi:hypothetical protein